MRSTRGVLDWRDCSSRVARKYAAARKEGRCDIAMTSHSVGKSGLFYKIYCEELAGSWPDFTVDIEDYMAFRTERDGKGYSVYGTDATEIRRHALTTSFLEDYSRWKLAFLPSMNKQHN